MKAIRISYDNGEYFVSAKSGSNFKSDSVWHDVEKAFARAWDLMEGDAKAVESARLVARLRELESQNAAMREACQYAAHVFSDYVALHVLKGTEDGRVKAERNRVHMNKMLDVIKAADGVLRVGKEWGQLQVGLGVPRHQQSV